MLDRVQIVDRLSLHVIDLFLQRLIAGMSSMVSGGDKVRSLLLISDGAEMTSEQQYAPLFRHAYALCDQLGLTISYVSLSEAMQWSSRKFGRFQVVGLKLGFKLSELDAANIVCRLKLAFGDCKIPLIYFDGDDDQNVQWPSVIEKVDLYVKKHRFRDDEAYARNYVGKSNLTDFVYRHFQVSFENESSAFAAALPRDSIEKIYTGWNIALDDKIYTLSKRLPPIRQGIERELDLVCRASVPEKAWTFPLREAPLRILEAHGTRLKMLLPRDRVSQGQYYREMLSSRICFSPFGYGELCWRDFEAILCGCLLIKPDMGHVKTDPDLFVPHVTYVPVRWDFNDLVEVCEYYAVHHEERQRIVDAARTSLLQALSSPWIVNSIDKLLNRLKIQ